MKITRNSSFDWVYIDNISYKIGEIDVYYSGRLYSFHTKNGFVIGNNIAPENIILGLASSTQFNLSNCTDDEKRYRLVNNYLNFTVDTGSGISFLTRATSLFASGDFSKVDFYKIDSIISFPIIADNSVDMSVITAYIGNKCFDVLCSTNYKNNTPINSSPSGASPLTSFAFLYNSDYLSTIIRIKNDDSSFINTLNFSSPVYSVSSPNNKLRFDCYGYYLA